MINNYFEAALFIYIVLGIATYVLMINYRNDMKVVVSTEQMEQAASMSLLQHVVLALMGLILIIGFWPVMAFNAFTRWKK